MISVIVPVYNVKNYIVNCVESIISQTYRDIEIILVDDGSTDGSGEICDDYALKDERIRVIHKKNGGLSDARNVAIDVAKGQQMTFIDGDDYVHPKMLEILLEKLESRNADIVTCRFRMVSEEETIPEEAGFCGKAFEDVETRIYNRDEAISSLDEIYVIACCKLYRSELFRELRYPKGKYHEDEYMIHRLLYEAKTVVCVDAELYYYVQRTGSITSQINWRKLEDAMGAFHERLQFADEMKWEAARKSTVLIFVNYLYSMSLKLQDAASREQKKTLRGNMRNVIIKHGDLPIPFIQVLYARSIILYRLYLCLGKIKRRIIGR